MEHMYIFKFPCPCSSRLSCDNYFTVSYPGSFAILRRDPNPNACLIGILSGETNPSEKVQGI